MKKSFKKAGAAVLSMAMLLSMGAISMPVYADRSPAVGASDNTTTNPLPGSINVKIAGLSTNDYRQGEGNSAGPDEKNMTGSNNPSSQAPATNKYQYLTLGTGQFTKATVKLYKVASLNNSQGWHWETGFNAFDSSVTDDTTGIYDHQNGKNDQFKTWEELLQRVELDEHGDPVTPAATTIDGNGEFTADAGALQRLASWLERQIKTNNATPISSSVIDYTNAVAGVSLPTDVAATINEIGYYLVVTETDQAGILVQPVLVSLKNGKENAKRITLKGSTISADKNIKSIKSVDGDEAKNYKEDGTKTSVVSTDGSTGVVGKKDVIHYEITAQLPQYDPNAEITQPFIIDDIIDDGLLVDRNTIFVYLSEDDESAMNKEARAESVKNTATNTGVGNWYLKAGTDYTIGNVPDSASPNGFRITIADAQMRAKVSGSTVTSTEDATGAEKVTVYYNDGAGHVADTEVERNIGGLTTMENMHIVVEFDATVVEDDFDVSYADYYTAATMTKDLFDGVADTDVLTQNELDELDAAATVAAGGTQTTATDAEKKAAAVAKQVYNAKALNEVADDEISDTVFDAALKTALTAWAGVLGTEGKVGLWEPENATDEQKEQVKNNRIQFILALRKANIDLNGEKNKAKVTYANNYSTGDGKATIPTKTTRVFSVNVEFDKVVEELTLTPAPELTAANATSFLADAAAIDAAWAPIAAKVATDGTSGKLDNITAEDIAALSSADKTAAESIALSGTGAHSMADKTPTWADTDEKKKQVLKVYDNYKAMNDEVDTIAAATSTDADQTNYTKQQTYASAYSGASAAQLAKAYFLIEQENANRAATSNYRQSTEEKPVTNAIFKLTKNYTADSNVATNHDELVGYAISTNDNGGNSKPGTLYVLTETFVPTAGQQPTEYDDVTVTAPATADVKYTEANVTRKVTYPKTGDSTITETKEVTGTAYYTLADDAKVAWDELTVGKYTLSELQVPTGFKKWDNVTFTISAEQDANGDYTGKYDATANVNQFGIAKTTGEWDENDSSTVLHFDFRTKDGQDATLEHNLYNQYADTLPATGGIGTVLFTAGGISVVLIAGALFVMYMKKKNSEDEE